MLKLKLNTLEGLSEVEKTHYKKIGEDMGFTSVASGPFVRSSFHASEMFEVSPS